MIIVADSSPFVLLVSIEQVEVLASLFKDVIIPPQVQAELSSPKRSEIVRAFIAAPPPWLRVVSPKLIEPIDGLHPGEAAAISLARELRADRVVIDERLGRQAASQRGLHVIGTVGVLEAAAERGFVDLGVAFEKVKETDFWVSPRFLDERLALFVARKRPGST